MAAFDTLHVIIWISSVITTPLCCPQPCSCTDKYGRHVAECSYSHITEVPRGLPSNVTTVSLSANRITFITSDTFDNVTKVTSLWMAHNMIAYIAPGTLTSLIHLRNLDVSHNKIEDFPWEDLQNLSALHLLKMNHNEMTHLPRNAFFNLKNLRSLRINNNKFTTIAEGTFDSLVSLEHLQIHNNPFVCSCLLDWLTHWISTTTTLSLPNQDLVICAGPEKLRGERIMALPKSECTRPKVTIKSEPNIHDSAVPENTTLVLTCEVKGYPKPLVMWSIDRKSQRQELALTFTKENQSESSDYILLSQHHFQVFNNGTLIIPKLQKEDVGRYSCSASNELGRVEDSVSVQVLEPTDVRPTTTTDSRTFKKRTTEELSVLNTESRPDVNRKFYINISPSILPTAEVGTSSNTQETSYPSHDGKCGLTANTRFISGHVYNGSLHDINGFAFDFGVFALSVSETEATLQVSPIFIHRQKNSNPNTEPGSPQTDPEHPADLYVCITANQQEADVQWTRIVEGIKTYKISNLRPGTNYSLCVTHTIMDCEVRVLFTTRKKVTNLLIIISVSICLLTVSTVPLLGATCFHLVYKYRSKTYKLILKAKDQCHMERNLTVNFNIHRPYTESQSRINVSQMELEAETESKDGEREVDTEESVVTESVTLSQGRGNLEDSEAGSEFSDRLPLGAEALIT
ncbi:immunoglobulin superfamily containing leucine-rich repeat protein 2-like [Cynoglossus semilaevis]|uniref:Immunoglobulin superfamily containing leucine-rich repeat protein 2-like n=1 Tax=Cynoglossus semilaevis TaxID=244447 RepID=A0A3P8WRS5_CYNSE|nr:immunoglobulin superfamily containing leucine-rich repeat protein 2-like [Cynoglossus semilaevis]